MSAIHYKVEPTIGCLYSIELEFANKKRSPTMQTRDARDSADSVLRTLEVDPEKTIRKVSVKVKDV